MSEDREPGKPDASGVRFPPPLYFAAAFALGILAHLFLPLPLPEGTPRLVGAPLVLAGLGLILWAVKSFRETGTPVEPWEPTTAIVTNGPYRFSRNPIYLGYAIGYAGASLAVGTLWPLLLLPATLGVISSQVVRKEERYLNEKFGGEYRAYQQRVRRWL